MRTLRCLEMFAALLFIFLFLTLPVYSEGNITQGTLDIRDKNGKIKSSCPLKHTDVKAEISGFIARVTVKQQFHNPMKEKIEAVYVFPLPGKSAVDDMIMKIGNRTIKGQIKKKEEAKKIYEDAKKQGKVASLLEQERPNIFTQSVANIMPGEKIDIEISYVEYLNYQDGVYEFVFPMVVGPRYIPGNEKKESQGTGWSSDTDKVPDASRITPPVTPKGTRAGHDISVSVKIDAGVPINKIRCVLHKVNIDHKDGSPKAEVSLDNLDSIPNKDFMLQYETAGKEIEDAFLYHTDKKYGGFFSLILQPPLHPRTNQITPKEMIFVIDTSGSQMGWPIEKAKETMKYCIQNMNEGDTFNLMAFSNNVIKLFPSSRPNTKENREKALDFLANRLGSGGTEMMPAVLEALSPKENPQMLRIVCFMTDGYVGNDMEVIDTVGKHIGNARLFSFGVGNSVNRYLLDKMAELGRGEAEYVTLNRHGDEVAEAFQRKIGTPVLTDIKFEWGNLPVKEVYPKRNPDLFSGKPLIIIGRYGNASKGEVVLKGKIAGKTYERRIPVIFPAGEPKNDVLASLWARTSIEELMDKDLAGIQKGSPSQSIKEAITRLGLDFRLMTQFTSFVAVEEKIVTKGGVPQKVAVPVEMPDGVSYEGIFAGESSKDTSRPSANAPSGAVMMKSQVSTERASSAKRISMPSSSTFHCREEDLDGRVAVPAKKPGEKVDDSLKSAIAKIKTEGTEKGAKVIGIEVKEGKIRVILTVTHISGNVLKALKEKGFSVSAYSPSNKIITGLVDAEKINDIAKFGFVEKIEPVLTEKGGSLKGSLYM